jgi:transcriptional regulator with XRE-family HTH domain
MSAESSEIDKRIGARVRAARLAQGLSQSSIGDSLDLSYQQIRKYELGVNRLSVVTLQKIANILGVPASVFLDPEHQEAKSAPSFDESAIDDARRSLLRLAETLGATGFAQNQPGHSTSTVGAGRSSFDDSRASRRGRRYSA